MSGAIAFIFLGGVTLKMIKGLSYENGIFFIGKRFISCAYNDQGKIRDWVKPLNIQSLLVVFRQVITSLPLWFKFVTVSYFSLIFIPRLIIVSGGQIDWQGLPLYFLFYYMLGNHFIFPKNLRKYHGAEHKVFSYRGIKTISNLAEIKQAKITNRYCSTNLVVAYFCSVIFWTVGLLLFFPFLQAVEWASYGSMVLAPLVNSQLNKRGMGLVKFYLLKISYYLQEKITTTSPDEIHLKTAIRSYRRLALREFPNEIRLRPKQRQVKKMAIIDITIIPVGTNEPSVSQYVADIHKVLETYQDKVDYKLTPMSTIIEGELTVLFDIIQALHEVPFSKGAQRVATNIRIDDRRDKQVTMAGKLSSVADKLKQAEIK